MKSHIKVGDMVEVTRGQETGERGRVLRFLPGGERAIVDGVGVVYKHMRSNPQQGQRGGRVEQNPPIHVSNLALVDTKTNKIARVRMRVVDGKRVRVNSKNGEQV
jgi:large subunit ribosomal protein L24